MRNHRRNVWRNPEKTYCLVYGESLSTQIFVLVQIGISDSL